jgi:trans-aconitate 2-methyltransferase
MIQKAQRTLSHIKFTVEDLHTYQPEEPIDLYFANAVFQWLSHRERITVIKKLIEKQSPGSVFAFQVPDNLMEPSHVAMRQCAESGPWASTLRSLNPARDEFQSPNELYAELKPLCSTVDIWHTHYYHILDDHKGIVEWTKGTGLRPFIGPLSPELKEGFLEAYLERLKTVYPLLYDGKVMLKYPRLFVVAVRA